MVFSSSIESLNSTLSHNSNNLGIEITNSEQLSSAPFSNNVQDMVSPKQNNTKRQLWHDKSIKSVSQESPCVLDNFLVLEGEDRSEAEAVTEAPVRPPRRARRKLKHLSLDGDTSLHEDSHQNDILFRTESSGKLNRDTQCLKGTACHHCSGRPVPSVSCQGISWC